MVSGFHKNAISLRSGRLEKSAAANSSMETMPSPPVSKIWWGEGGVRVAVVWRWDGGAVRVECGEGGGEVG